MFSVVPLAAYQVFKNGDEDWYKNSVPEWQKETSWILGENFKVPKSYDLLSRLTAVVVEDIATDAPDEDRRYFKAVFDALPSIIPTIAQPAFEAWADYSFFYDNSIVPKKEQNLESVKKV